MRRYFYMYIPLDIDKEKSTRFVVESDGVPLHDTFKGVVVARNSKAFYFLGHTSNSWVNPISDLKCGCKPSFIPINEDEIRAKFSEVDL
jgi:hypothetical protein